MSVTRRRLLGGAATVSAASILGVNLRPAFAVTPGKPFAPNKTKTPNSLPKKRPFSVGS